MQGAVAGLVKSSRGREAPEQFHIRYEKIYDQHDFAIKVAGSYKSPFTKASGLFDFKEKAVKSRLLVDMQRVYYRIGVDLIKPEYGFFREKGFTAPESWVYVANIAYGKRILIGLESSSEMEDLYAAATASFNAIVASGKMSTEVKHRDVLNKVKMRIAGFGVTGGEIKNAAGSAMKGVSSFIGMLDMERSVTAGAPGVPLAYTFQFVNNHDIARIQTSTDYTRRTCAKTAELIDVEVRSLYCRSHDDDGSAAEIYGDIEIQAFESPGKRLQPLNGQSNLVWSLGESDAVDVEEHQEIPVDATRTYLFSGDSIRRGTAYIQVTGWMSEEDDSSADDHFGIRNLPKVYVHELLTGEADSENLKPKDKSVDEYVKELYKDYFQTRFTEDGWDQQVIVLYRIRPQD